MNTDHNCGESRCYTGVTLTVTREEEATTLKFGNDLHLYHLRNTDQLVAVNDMNHFLIQGSSSSLVSFQR